MILISSAADKTLQFPEFSGYEEIVFQAQPTTRREMDVLEHAENCRWKNRILLCVSGGRRQQRPVHWP